MVTLDKLVKNVGKFDGNLRRHRTYERAKANVELIDNDPGMIALEESLKKMTGYDDMRLPMEPTTDTVKRGDITFYIKSEATTKRPQYKKAVDQMENYLTGIQTLLKEERVITGVAKEQDIWCIGIPPLLEQYDIILSGIMAPGVKQTITYEIDKKLRAPKMMDMSFYGSGIPSEENFKDYVQRDLLRHVSDRFVKDYNSSLKKEIKSGNIVPINTLKGYKEESTKSKGVNWGYVKKTLLNDDEKSLGELNILADSKISFEEKKERMPYYDLFLREPFGMPTVYIGILSLYDRIQDLKTQKMITSDRTKYSSTELV